MSRFWDYACNMDPEQHRTFNSVIPLGDGQQTDWINFIGRDNIMPYNNGDFVADTEVKFMYLLFIDQMLDSEVAEQEEFIAAHKASMEHAALWEPRS